MSKTLVAYFMKWAIPCMKNKFSCIKVFYYFNVTENTILHCIFMFYKTTIYYTAKMINHGGTLLLTQNIFHTIRHYDIHIRTPFFN